MQSRTGKSLVLVIFFCTFMSLFAQTDGIKTTSETKTWFGAGVGLGSFTSIDGNFGTSLGLSLNHLRSDRSYKVRFVRVKDLDLDLFGTSPPPESVWDIGILYGFARPRGKGSIIFSGGVSYVGGMKYLTDDYDNYKEIDISTIGLPLEAQFVRSFSSGLGLSTTLFGNINSENSFGGVTLNLIFGKLR